MNSSVMYSMQSVPSAGCHLPASSFGSSLNDQISPSSSRATYR
nr:MAG TPA: hypothetical protein [Caudoviricetes sp.]